MNSALEVSVAPWEPLGRSLDGHGAFPEEAAQARRSAGLAVGQGPSPAIPEAGSGLTRRGVIYAFVRGHPGTHVRGMARDLGIATGDLQYHLLWLERHGYVKTRKGGFYRFVFPTMVFREEQEVLLGVISQETQCEMLMLMLGGAVTQGQLARSLGCSQPTVSWHLERLIGQGVVAKAKTNGGVVYSVSADRADLLKFVRSYHPEVWSRWEGRLGGLVAAEEGGSQGTGLMPPAVVEVVGKR